MLKFEGRVCVYTCVQLCVSELDCVFFLALKLQDRVIVNIFAYSLKRQQSETGQ